MEGKAMRALRVLVAQLGASAIFAAILSLDFLLRDHDGHSGAEGIIIQLSYLRMTLIKSLSIISLSVLLSSLLSGLRVKSSRVVLLGIACQALVLLFGFERPLLADGAIVPVLQRTIFFGFVWAAIFGTSLFVTGLLRRD